MIWVYSYRKRFPWKDPITLNEKITWLSLYSDTRKWSELADKYEVRKYVENVCGLKYLTKCYGVWNHEDDINFESLPQSFVIKCTHDCGSTIVVNNKYSLDISELKKSIKGHLQKKFGYETCEPHYWRITPRVMAEELLVDTHSDYSKSLVDYKIWCINGRALFVFVCYDRNVHSDKKEESSDHYAIYDLYSLPNWEPIRENLSDWYRKGTHRDIPRPENLEEMIECAEKLSKGFPQVRVDLYNIGGKIYFGEMTFTSNCGRMTCYTQEFQEKIGRLVKIPELVK